MQMQRLSYILSLPTSAQDSKVGPKIWGVLLLHEIKCHVPHTCNGMPMALCHIRLLGIACAAIACRLSTASNATSAAPRIFSLGCHWLIEPHATIWDSHNSACCMHHSAALDRLKAYTLRCLQPLSWQLRLGLLSVAVLLCAHICCAMPAAAVCGAGPRPAEHDFRRDPAAAEEHCPQQRGRLHSSGCGCASSGPQEGLGVQPQQDQGGQPVLDCQDAVKVSAGNNKEVQHASGCLLSEAALRCCAFLLYHLCTSCTFLGGAVQRSLMAAPSTCTFRAALLSLLQTGDRLTGGDIFGLVHENTLIDHKIMVQPGAQGTVSWIAPQGEYTLTDKVLELEFAGNKKVSGWLAWT